MVEKIISGGQSGADRAALDWAMASGIPHGGYCPKGRIAEDGVIDAKYLLQETGHLDYSERTELNVVHSDGTAIFSIKGVLDGGSRETSDFAKKHKKPWVHIRQKLENPVQSLNQFIEKNKIRVLNIAGPRASREPGVGQFVMDILDQSLK
jgi:hypothetical protein